MTSNLVLPLILSMLVLRISASSLTPTPRGQDWPSGATETTKITYFNNKTVFQSPPNYTVPGTLYARTVQLGDKSLLATWENYSPEPPPVYFPIFRSTDYGESWDEISRVEDTSGNDYGMRYQPVLYVLPRDWASWSAGTVLLAGSSIPTDLSSTDLQLYASRDDGRTWTFVSSIAKGGEAVPDNGLTPVWEPFLMLYYDEDDEQSQSQGQGPNPTTQPQPVLICYYSDQRDPAHGQKLVHQVTADGKTWGPVVDDVVYANYTSRPGMPVVSRMGGNKYIYTYEYGGGPVDGVLPVNYTFPVFYKISSDPTTFGQVDGLPIVVTNDPDRTVPVSSPYVIYDHQTSLIIVSCGTLSPVFVNRAAGDVDAWESRPTAETVSYTRSLRIIYDDDDDNHLNQALLIAGGGKLPPSQANKVAVGVVDVHGW